MSQPFDRSSRHKARGELDTARGEFWVESPFQMPGQRQNLSSYEQNYVYLNQNGERFIDVSFGSQAAIDSDSRSVIAADFNSDNKLDILVGSVGGGPLRLFENQFPAAGASVRLNLINRTGNRQAIGARVTLECAGRTIVRDLFPSDGFMGQSPVNLLIGTGPVEQIDRLTIRWPGGATQHFDNVPVNHVVTIEETVPQFQATPFAEPAAQAADSQ